MSELKSKQRVNSTYLVAEYLKLRGKGQICDMKRCCKANNVGQRVLQLRRNHNWEISTVLIGREKGVPIYEYIVTKIGKLPSKYINNEN